MEIRSEFFSRIGVVGELHPVDHENRQQIWAGYG
jgi:hypothetical protein